MEVSNLGMAYEPAGPRALDGVTFALHPGECLGVLGESGSGKSTLAKLVMGLAKPSCGSVRFRGQDLQSIPGSTLRSLRTEFQILFQDAYAALHPRHRVEALVMEPLVAHGLDRQGRQERVAHWLDQVELDPRRIARRFPHELSGGERQRVALARALIVEPSLLVADEPVSALDPAVRSSLLDLLERLRGQLGLAVLLISHDVRVLARLAARILVLRSGQLLEQGPTAQILGQPSHSYTRVLIAAAGGACGGGNLAS